MRTQKWKGGLDRGVTIYKTIKQNDRLRILQTAVFLQWGREKDHESQPHWVKFSSWRNLLYLIFHSLALESKICRNCSYLFILLKTFKVIFKIIVLHCENLSGSLFFLINFNKLSYWLLSSVLRWLGWHWILLHLLLMKRMMDDVTLAPEKRVR